MTALATRDAIEVVDEMLRFARGRLAKAAKPAALAARQKLFAEAQPAMAAELVDYFDGLLARAGIRKDVAFPFDPEADIDWEEEQARLRVILDRWYVTMGDAAFGALGDQLGIELTFNLAAASTKSVRDKIALNVTSITDTLREELRNRVEAAVAEGLSVEQLVVGTDSVPGLGELFGNRAQTIALTETANAYNTSSVVGYRESGLIDEVDVLDGTGDEACAEANGSTWTLAEAEANPTEHPNCQRSFVPVVAR